MLEFAGILYQFIYNSSSKIQRKVEKLKLPLKARNVQPVPVLQLEQSYITIYLYLLISLDVAV